MPVQSRSAQAVHNSSRAASNNLNASGVAQPAVPRQLKANDTGLPDNLKTGIETLSGFSLADVKVHYNSDKPAQLQALAFAQGTDIYVASGQERHLAHEAWHVVQQKQGRVRPTLQRKGKVSINDDNGLEREADVMGLKALQMYSQPSDGVIHQLKTVASGGMPVAQLVELQSARLNVVGENHPESNERRHEERRMCAELVGCDYWMEEEFKVQAGDVETDADPHFIKFIDALHLIFESSGDLAAVHSNGLELIVSKAWHSWRKISQLISLAKRQWDQTRGIAYPGNLDRAQLINRDKILQDRFDQVEALKIAWMALAFMYEDKPWNDDHKEKGWGYYRAITNARNAMLAGMGPRNVRGMELSRSGLMHEAAQQKFQIPGVWKIGQNHVDDIQNGFPGSAPPRYNLVPLADFNRRFYAIFYEDNINDSEESKTQTATTSAPALPSPAVPPSVGGTP